MLLLQLEGAVLLEKVIDQFLLFPLVDAFLMLGSPCLALDLLSLSNIFV